MRDGGRQRTKEMRYGVFAIIGIAALAISTDTASARDGCGRGMAWNGYGCVPAYAPPYGGGYYRPGYGGGGYGHGPMGPRDCGPGMNSDGYRCVPIRGAGPMGPRNCGPGMNSNGYSCVPIVPPQYR